MRLPPILRQLLSTTSPSDAPPETEHATRLGSAPVDDRFFVKPGYQARRKVKRLADRFVDSKPIVHQPDVYPLAAYFARRLRRDTIVDVGCGGGGKLAQLGSEFQVVGVDMAQNVEHCRASYDFGAWIEWDLERRDTIPVDPELLERSVVICSDVIEHLVDPTALLLNLRAMLDRSALCVLSTPERELTRGPADMGPPANKYHVREWSLAELDRLLRAHRLEPAFIGLTTSDDHRREKKTTLAIIPGSAAAVAPSVRASPPPVEARVAAILPHRGDPKTVRAARWLAGFGVELHLLDLWISDNEEVELRALLGDALLGFERFPKEPGAAEASDAELLARMADLERELGRDLVLFGR